MSALDELVSLAREDLEICNACRYCEGYCAVFPAMTRSIEFTSDDVMVLANLCHDCRGCYQACMYAPPHEFGVDLPKTLADVRNAGYRELTWPPRLKSLLDHPVATKTAAVVVGLLIAGGMALASGGSVFGKPRNEPGDFYRVISADLMTGVFLALSLVCLVLLGGGFMQFLGVARRRNPDFRWRELAGATWDALILRYLRGGGPGCFHPEPEEPSHRRRGMHIAVVGGLGLAFLATIAAAVEQHLLGIDPPYPLLSVPVVSGVIGGVMVVIGGAGLWLANTSASDQPHSSAVRSQTKDYAFIAALEVVSITGLLLFVLRSTSAMGTLLLIHLASVVALYLTLPFSKFMHAPHRLGALLIDASERRAEQRPKTLEPAIVIQAGRKGQA
jgi:citrate/tricarballylate utilization protein